MTYVLTGFVLLLALHIARRLGWATDLPRRARWGVGAATLAIAAWAGLSGGFARGADNAAALRLYERRGFEALSRRRDYYAPGIDALVMRARPGAGQAGG